MSFRKHNFKKILEKKVSFDYLLSFPKHYNDRDKFPIILYLHGSEERGTDIEKLKNSFFIKYVENQKDFPFIVVVPQCPLNCSWFMQTDALYEIVREIIFKCNIEERKIYVTGISMGGFGCWHLLEEYPDLFAAAIPICGGTVDNLGFPERIKKVKDIPIWAFHGAKDTVVPPIKSQELVKILEEAGGNIKFTLYPDTDHECWTQTYKNPDIYEWLLSKQK